MELHELIEAVKAAKDKGELETLVKRELGIDLDRRKSLEVLRQSVLAGLGVDSADSESAPVEDKTGPMTLKDESKGGATESETIEPEEVLAPVTAAEAGAPEAEIVEPGLTMPEIGDEPVDEEPAPSQRLLRNKKTGRVFVWTPALAKLADLVEV
ncbi:hypothetical protein [Pseudomonas sp. B392_1p]|uniref:hypothetical protein n=1 Tax=Pseudomonas sp. B392_1p TaxID=3457507 RepID=UPI003FD34E88